MNFSISSEFKPELNRWNVSIAGEIDIFNSSEFKHELMQLIDDKPSDLYIDCLELEYIDSTALGSLVAVLKRVKEFNCEIYLKNVRPTLGKLFKITNLDKVFIIVGGDENE